jgi:hypothetical protein
VHHIEVAVRRQAVEQHARRNVDAVAVIEPVFDADAAIAHHLLKQPVGRLERELRAFGAARRQIFDESGPRLGIADQEAAFVGTAHRPQPVAPVRPVRAIVGEARANPVVRAGLGRGRKRRKQGEPGRGAEEDQPSLHA